MMSLTDETASNNDDALLSLSCADELPQSFVVVNTANN